MQSVALLVTPGSRYNAVWPASSPKPRSAVKGLPTPIPVPCTHQVTFESRVVMVDKVAAVVGDFGIVEKLNLECEDPDLDGAHRRR